MSRVGFVYLIAFDEGEGLFSSPVKVGIAHNPFERLIDIQVGCPFVLGVVERWEFPSIHVARRHEQLFHEHHHDIRLQGEWFDISPEGAAAKLDEWHKRFRFKDMVPVSDTACGILGYKTFGHANQAISALGKMTRAQRSQRAWKIRKQEKNRVPTPSI